MKDTEIAWLAGLFEGEGCINFQGKNCVRLDLGSTDEDVIRKLLETVGVGKVQLDKLKENRKPFFRWILSVKADVIEVLMQIYPYMGERRAARIDEAFKRLEKNKGINLPITNHGTRAGYRKEIYRGLEPCELCRAALLQYYKDQRQKRKG